jgi:large subunit ribosomal protein L13
MSKATTEATTGNVGSDSWMATAETADRNWWIVDASGQRVGRLATQIATLLRGKHKPTFTPHCDNGDFVIVINTDKVEMTGTKWNTKKYYRHSRFFGSMKEKTAAQMQEDDSTFIVHEAVRGMLPTNKMSYDLIKKLKTYKGAEHDHAVQKPQAYKLSTKKGE